MSTGAFSLVEQACHLRDLEREAYGVRIRRIVEEDCPKLEEFDGDNAAQERGYLNQDLDTAVRAFATERATSVEFLEKITSEQAVRKARFGTFGVITLQQLVEMMLEHDDTHRAEIDLLVKELGPRA